MRGTITSPYANNLTINTTERGNLSMTHQPDGVAIVKGPSILLTKVNEDSDIDQENATAVLVDLNGVRTEDPRSSTAAIFFLIT